MDCLILAVVFMGAVSKRKTLELDHVIHLLESRVPTCNA
jgi:hypothetical protein